MTVSTSIAMAQTVVRFFYFFEFHSIGPFGKSAWLHVWPVDPVHSFSKMPASIDPTIVDSQTKSWRICRNKNEQKRKKKLWFFDSKQCGQRTRGKESPAHIIIIKCMCARAFEYMVETAVEEQSERLRQMSTRAHSQFVSINNYLII